MWEIMIFEFDDTQESMSKAQFEYNKRWEEMTDCFKIPIFMENAFAFEYKKLVKIGL